MTRLIVTGSATVDGRPIYMRRDGTWVDRLADADVVEAKSDCEQLLVTARANEATVCDPYAIDVVVDGASVRAASLREVIRATGPTVAS
ncbi:MAG: DUF2849 domain-containing protein [Nannocystaceae bacterium]